MDINEININEQLGKMAEEFKSLKNENIQLKKEIEKNKESILNLNLQLYKLNKRYQVDMNELEEKYNEQFKQLLYIITNKENNEKEKEKNEIIINNKNNIINLRKSKTMINKKNSAKELEINIKKEKAKKGKNKEETIDLNKLYELFETKLFQIFVDDVEKIEPNVKNDIKKISTAIFIGGNIPNDNFDEFIENNLKKNYDGDKEEKDKKELIFATKKSDIYMILEESQLDLSKKYDKKNVDEFIKDLREKCGLTEEDYSNEELKKEIKKNKYDAKKTMISIFKNKKLYIKDD